MNDLQCINPMAIGAPAPLTMLYLNTSGVLYPSALPLLTPEQDFNTVKVKLIIRPAASMNADLNALQHLTIEMWSLDSGGGDIEHKGPVTFSLGGGGGLNPSTTFNLGALLSDAATNPSTFDQWNLKKVTGKIIYGFRWTITPAFITLGLVTPPIFIMVPTSNT